MIDTKKIVAEFIERADVGNNIPEALQWLQDLLFELLGFNSFEELKGTHDSALMGLAMFMHANNIAKAATFLNLGRTTLSEMLRNKNMRPDRPPTSNHFTDNRNFGKIKRRQCKCCFSEFDGDFTIPCPDCGNSNKKMIQIKRDRRQTTLP